LKTLCIFTDEEGLMRLKTKLTRIEDTNNFICPILLPSNHLVVEKLIKTLMLLHAAVQVVLIDIRQHFWILRAWKTDKKVYI